MTKPPEEYHLLLSGLQTPITTVDKPLLNDSKPNQLPASKPQLMTTIKEEAENQENQRRVNSADKFEQNLSLILKMT